MSSSIVYVGAKVQPSDLGQRWLLVARCLPRPASATSCNQPITQHA